MDPSVLLKRKIKKWITGLVIGFITSAFGVIAIIGLVFSLIVAGSSSNSTEDCENYSESMGSIADIQTSEKMEENDKAIFDFMKQRFPEATDEGICGMLGNFQQESTLNPSAVERPGDDSSGHGIAQWTAGRADNLRSYAQKNNKEWNDLGLQLSFLEYELKGSEKASVSALKETDIEKAVTQWEKLFERAGVPAIQNRVNYGKNWYAKFKGSSVDSSIVDTSTDSTDVVSGTLSCGSSDDMSGEANADGWTMPVKNFKGSFNSEQDFGECTSRQGNWHHGLDFGSVGFTDEGIYAVNDGKIIEITPNKFTGSGIYIVQDVGDRQVVYQEFTDNPNDIFVKVGDTVKRGQKIAKLDNRGGSGGVGSHLHLSITKKGGKAQEGLAHAFSNDGYWEDPLKILKK